MLSNWHVFQGASGVLGDRIVQPGRFDDNRVGENGCGRLVRSFLGLAGDCAIASLEGRGAEETILELDVPVRRLGDPELGDRVVKSGRTTAVTYGVVTRLHTITRLSYGQGITEQIGGFEIGPDAERPAADGEISTGGDSGSAWMALDDRGEPTDMMLGLHFAGEAAGVVGEHALACYASSVFSKLEISPLPAPATTARVVVIQAVGGGYDANFLPGHELPIPVGERGRGGRLRAAAARRGPGSPSHALLARDERVAAVLPLGGVERGRQRAAAALAQRDRVQARPGLPRRAPGRRRPVRQQPPGPRPHRPPRRPAVGHARGSPAREHGLVPVHEHRAPARRLQPVRQARPVGPARGCDLRGRVRRRPAPVRRRRPDLQAQRPRVPRRARPPLLLEGDRLRRGRDAQGQGLRAHPGRPRRQARIARPGAVQPLPGGDPRARRDDGPRLRPAHHGRHHGALQPPTPRSSRRARSPPARRSSVRRAAAGAGARRARGASRRSPARSGPCARSRPPASRR